MTVSINNFSIRSEAVTWSYSSELRLELNFCFKSFEEWQCEKKDYIKNESFTKDKGNVPETGCLSIIVLNASGDLAKKKTFPALFNFYRQRICNQTKFTFLEDVSKFLQLIKYVSGSYDAAEGFQALGKAISEHETSRSSSEGSARRLFYLALPPSVYLQVCKLIKNTCTNKCIFLVVNQFQYCLFQSCASVLILF
ncbi:glucose-6-phosphate 1-dehydrogenase, cytoplasmic isoform [Olea europaea subsp. europaea]|uniref:glucose-6-phosphate dehydrogenase (NADP(+)) n=1 Tax=Olea europaea subsp. europaea TaxID=158383 RepID=A0A8S0R9E8_OLEEU|nr:glucose-6-phosphate 1-dehydrogenase, cytoplasmic isoform [Olea europaea subsp. europaea]